MGRKKKKSIKRKLVPGQRLLPEMFLKSSFRPSSFTSPVKVDEKVPKNDESDERNEQE